MSRYFRRMEAEYLAMRDPIFKHPGHKQFGVHITTYTPGEHTMNDTITTDVVDEIKALVLIERQVSEVEAQLAGLKQIQQAAEHRVITAFQSDPLQGPVEYDGRKWKAAQVAVPAVIDGQQDDVVEWIKANGGADLVKPAMHWARRDSFLKQKLIDDEGNVTIPEELAGALEVKDFPVLTKRKVS